MKEIYVGHKNTVVYVTVSMEALKKEPEITLRARGSGIVKAATVLELLKRYGYKSNGVDIFTDDVPVKEGSTELRPITAIEIKVRK